MCERSLPADATDPSKSQIQRLAARYALGEYAAVVAEMKLAAAEYMRGPEGAAFAKWARG